VLAIGYGLTSAGSTGGTGIAAAVLEALGVLALAGSLVTARERGHLRTRPVSVVLVGLDLPARALPLRRLHPQRLPGNGWGQAVSRGGARVAART
jgi:hypothetical protein